MKSKMSQALTATSMLLASTVAFAGGDAAEGKKIAEGQCVTCHGVDGVSQNPGWPILAGQYETYLVYALESYKSGKRNNAIMAGFAGALSDDDIKNVSAWYARQDAALKVAPNP